MTLAELAAHNGLTVTSAVVGGSIVAFLGLAIGIGSIVITWWWRRRDTKRVLEYGLLSSIPLLSTPPNVAAQTDIQLTVQGVAVKNPTVVTLRLDAKSAKDIRANDFDPDTPVVFTIDRRLVQELAPAEDQAARPKFEIIPGFNDDFELQILPGMIHKGSESAFRFITEGIPSGVSHTSGDLADVEIRSVQRFGDERPPGLLATRRQAMVLGLLFLMALLIIILALAIQLNAVN